MKTSISSFVLALAGTYFMMFAILALAFGSGIGVLFVPLLFYFISNRISGFKDGTIEGDLRSLAARYSMVAGVISMPYFIGFLIVFQEANDFSHPFFVWTPIVFAIYVDLVYSYYLSAQKILRADQQVQDNRREHLLSTVTFGEVEDDEPQKRNFKRYALPLVVAFNLLMAFCAYLISDGVNFG